MPSDTRPDGIPAPRKTNKPSGAQITPVGGAWYRAAPYQHGHATSDRMPDPRELNYAEVNHSRPPAALVAVTEEVHIWPTSVNSDTGSAWGALFDDWHYREGDGKDSLRGSALPAPSERPKNISRGRGLQCHYQENVASTAVPGQDWSGAVKEENSWTDITSSRPPYCSAAIPGWGDNCTGLCNVSCTCRWQSCGSLYSSSICCCRFWSIVKN